MFVTFYDPRENRDIYPQGRSAMTRDLTLRKKHSAPRTVEQLLFLRERTDYVDGDIPAPIAS